MVTIAYFSNCRTGPIQRHRLCFAGGRFWPSAFFMMIILMVMLMVMVMAGMMILFL